MMFWWLALALCLMAVAFIVLPILFNAEAKASREESVEGLNIALIKQQLQELEKQMEAGFLGESAYRDRRAELEYQLLEDAAPRPGKQDVGRYRIVLFTSALLVPLAAWLIYQQVGAGQAWELSQRYQTLNQQLAEGEVDESAIMAFVGELSSYTAGNPTPDWLFLQGQLYMQIGAFRAAAESFGRLAMEQPGQADILARQAQALYLAADRKLDNQTNALIDQVLAINPHQPTVLGLRGMHAFENGDYPAAIENWQLAIQGMPAGSQSREVLEQGIAQARSVAGIESPVKSTEPGNGFGEGIRVRVELADDAEPAEGSLIYVVAQAPGGGMPFAVVRLPVDALPTEVTLDDSTAMAPGNSLSKQSKARVTARLSRSGNAMAQAGDWQGRSDVLTPQNLPELLTVLIDQQI